MSKIINKSELIAKDIDFKISKKIFAKVIPSERKLAEEYKVSRNTIRNALEILLNGKKISLTGKNYQINQPKEDYDWLEIFGQKTNIQILNYIEIDKVFEANKKLTQKLKVPLATLVHLLVYKRVTKEKIPKTLSIDYIYAPEKLVSQLPINEIKMYSFWQLMTKMFKGKPLKEYQSLSVESVTTEEAQWLGIPVRSKILQRTSLIFISETPIYFISKKITANSILI